MHRITAEDLKKRILYEDGELLVVNKPAGLAVQHASSDVMDLESLLRGYLKGGWLGIIHRLDQPVEGILVFAKNREAAGKLSGAFSRGQVVKEYLAVVRYPETGFPFSGTTERIDYLISDSGRNLSQIAGPSDPRAKKAVLEFSLSRLLAPPYALLRVRLHTGRHHQIRVQLSHANLPVLGDRKYGTCPPGYRGPLCLAAVRLSFTHPRTGKHLDFALSEQEIAFLRAGFPTPSPSGGEESDSSHTSS